MAISNFFEREIQFIESEDFRDFVRWFFDEKVGAWFRKSGASSSGRFHPIFAQGEGGLIRHTRSVALVCEELLRMSCYAYMNAEYKDYARIACLLHDTCKYGENDEVDKTAYKNHGALAANKIACAWTEFFDSQAPELLLMAVRSHMGQWTESKDERPFTSIDRLVHLSDYIASRSFWDIPQISNEYYEDSEEALLPDEACLPF